MKHVGHNQRNAEADRWQDKTAMNECRYRFNRMKFKGQGFFRLLSACATCKTIIRPDAIYK
jgi:hypothetical protein